ncbi:MAG: AraC family transcriptional regulator ligand-binding domain-containing protein [Oceanospirillaceae bacterium]
MPKNNITLTRFNIKLIHALLQLAKHQGVSVDNALTNSIIDQSTLETPGQRYPTAAFEALIEHLIGATGNLKLATLAAQATQPRMLGSLGFVMSTAKTLLDAYQMLSDYFALIYEGVHLEILHEQENCILNLHFNKDHHHVSEFFIACLLNWPRWLTGRAIHAQSISYNFQLDNPLSYQQQLALEVNFEQPCNQVVIHNQYMNLACSETNPEMHQLHCNYADSLLIKFSQKQALIAQTKQQIRKILQATNHNEGAAIRREQIAANLNMSLRTFQRKLNAQESNFQKIYDSVRHETCLQLVSNSNLSFSQIAYKLGFANLSAFQKAFKRWMKVPPSQYRKQLALVQIDSQSQVAIPAIDLWHKAMSEQQLTKEINLKLASISAFSKHLLTIAGLAQQTNTKPLTLEQLARISQNSIARLSIYLWPVQQQQLIENIDNADPKTALITFTPQLTISLMLKELPAEQKLKQHFSIASFYQTQNEHNLAFKHFSLIDLQWLKHQDLQAIAAFCVLQINSSSTPSNTHLDALYDLQINCRKLCNKRTQGQEKEESNENNVINQLYIEQLAVWVDLNYLEKAQIRVSDLLNEQLTLNQSVELAIITAQLLVAVKSVEEALTLLTYSAEKYCDIKLDINSESNVLIDISQQLERLGDFCQQQPQAFITPAKCLTLNNTLNNQLSILQKITTICLQENLPLKAAGAIANMLAITLTHCDYYYASFAAAQFAWVCSWFAADIKLAEHCRDRALFLAKQHSEQHLKACELVLFTKVNHWLEPLEQSINALQQEDFNTPLTGKNTLERQVLLQQLLLCTGENLSFLADNCEQILAAFPPTSANLHPQPLTSILYTISTIQTAKDIEQAPIYFNSSIAFGHVFSALYRFDYSLWPLLQHWDAQIESETSSHYVATEAVFMCILMRIHHLQATQNNELAKARIDGDINRLKMWKKQQGDNFSVQYAIAKAVYTAKFLNIEQAIDRFESTYVTIEQQAFLHHKILFYHYYAQLLKSKQPALSALCAEKKSNYLTSWINQRPSSNESLLRTSQ